ncbi:hypothetical protein BC940DRAFT_350622 [Gongronella butleri]|nr:hypothetical protein BC940DRAFT_350622 [Gongronella butleri]
MSLYRPSKRQAPPETCPPCFNCQLPTNLCTNGGSCDASGVCSCPTGWGSPDCSSPLCGSLYASDRPERPKDQACACDDGWGGVNCNVCQNDNACQAGKGQNATCIKSAIGLKAIHAWCATTNIPWIDNTHVSLQCDWLTNECIFQFWKDQEEQFFCEMSDCSQTLVPNADYDVHGQCKKAECRCMKGAFMCGQEVDMSEMVANVVGPSEWYCKDGRECWYNEYSTLVSVFPDNIQLNCDVGECVNDQDYVDTQPIERSFSRFKESMIGLAILIAALIIFFGTRVTAKRQRRMFGTAILLDDDSSDDAMDNVAGEPVQLTFQDVAYTVGGKKVLSDVSGFVEPGQLVAVMGPSGAGKSTLLDILARKHKRGVTSGHVLVNGQVPPARQFRRVSSYVDQDDNLMGTLTVRETLMYAAMLRLPRKMPLKHKQRRVQEIMQELGIDSIADHLIGNPGHERGISGGEKRRVSLAKAMVTNPQLLFLDEPTSGLDAYNANMVIACLKRLCRHGKRTIVVTIHQPRSNIFKMFDSLMLLANGEPVYFGPVLSASSYFSDIGYPVPSDYNVADYLIDLTMKQPAGGMSPSSSFGALDDLASDEQLHDLGPAADDNVNTRLLDDQHSEYDLLTTSNHAHHLVESYRSSTLRARTLTHIQRVHGSADPAYAVWVDTKHHDSPLSLAQFYHEFSTLSSRTFINLYRHPLLFLAHVGCSLFLGLLLGCLFWQVEVDLSGVQNRLGVLFFMCALLGFASTSALDMFSRERVLFMRERENGYYRPASYFAAKILFDMVPLRVLPPLIMGSIAYYMIGLNAHWLVFVKFLVVLVLFNLCAAGLCFCFATAFSSMAIANLLTNLVMLFSMLFGGFLLNKDHIPKMLSWLQYLSFFNYGYEALIVNELKGLTLRDKTIADIQIPGSLILSRFGFNGQAFWADIVRLGLFCTVTLTTAYLFLKYLVKERR